MSGAQNQSPSVETIQRLCAGTFHVSVRDITSDRRDASTVLARHAAIWLSRRLTPHSTPVIGRLFGKRDHTTVLYAIQRMEGRIDANPGIAALMEGLINCLTLPVAA